MGGLEVPESSLNAGHAPIALRSRREPIIAGAWSVWKATAIRAMWWRAWISGFKSQNGARFERLALVSLCASTADQGIERLEQWLREIGSPVSLEETGIRADAISDIVEDVFDPARVRGGLIGCTLARGSPRASR